MATIDTDAADFEAIGQTANAGVNPAFQKLKEVSGALATDLAELNAEVEAISIPTVADTTDTTCWPLLSQDQTGTLAPKTDGGLTYNANTGTLTATAFSGPLTGNVTGTASVASTVTVADSSDATSFIAMFDSATGNLAPKTDPTLTFDATTGRLTATGGVIFSNSSPGNTALTHYSEGTWTPTITSTGGGSGTYSSQLGLYRRIGKAVFVQFEVTITNHSGSGDMNLGGLPFAANDTSGGTVSGNYQSTPWILNHGSITASHYPLMSAASNGTEISLRSLPVGPTTTPSSIALDTACTVRGAFFYLTD